jgi:predicted glycosyltransferase
VALYSHDAQGLGHLRRNLAIAGALSRLRPNPDLLMLTGAAEVTALPRPSRCDTVLLPAVVKSATGTYSARHLTLGLEDLLSVRTAILRAALSAFRPDLLIVDKHPRGAFGELETALPALADSGTRIVLGLRDVLDDPAQVRWEWRADRGTEALVRWYDEIWVYGDPAVCDPTADLELPPALAARVVHLGYLGRGQLGAAPPRRDSAPYVLGLVGGGGDGRELALAFARAHYPAGHRGVLVTGSQMPAEDRAAVRRLARRRRDLELLDFVGDLDSRLDGTSAVVTMGGYNSVCEVLGRGLPALVVPRVRPRREQLIRAQALAGAGLLDVLPPDRLGGPALTEWLAAAVRRPRRLGTGVRLDGLRRLPDRARDLLAGNTAGLTAREAVGA